MQTEYRAAQLHEQIDFNGAYALRSRVCGGWSMTSWVAPINFWVYDEQHNRMVYLDGYVYAPDMRKRPLVRQLEAILTSYDPVP